MDTSAQRIDGVKFMASASPASTKRPKMSERAEIQLQFHFPNWASAWLWRRKSNNGYTTLPRTLPIVMQAVDAQSKGQPAGHTLFCLWARSPDHPLVTIENPATFAAEAGFDGARAVDTWRRRMKRLVELNLLVSKKGPSGDFHYVLLMNPNVAMEVMHSNKLVQTDLYARFLDRLTEVGGLGELHAIHAFWTQMREHAAAEEAKKTATANAAPTVSPQAAEATTPTKEAVAETPQRRRRVRLKLEDSSPPADEGEGVTSPVRPRRRRKAAGA